MLTLEAYEAQNRYRHSCETLGVINPLEPRNFFVKLKFAGLVCFMFNGK
jgi:hypothetical protein